MYAALEKGYTVSIFNRGRTEPRMFVADFDRVEKARRRPGASATGVYYPYLGVDISEGAEVALEGSVLPHRH